MDRFAARNLMDGVEFTGGMVRRIKTGCWQRRGWTDLSSEEGWGLAVNEYLASELPVVAYDLPFFRRFSRRAAFGVAWG